MGTAASRRTKVGDRIPDLVRPITRTTVFLFNSATFGPHRFHYDVEAARAEGFADVIVTSTLVAAYFEQAVRAWSGDSANLRFLSERSLAPAVAGDTLTIGGAVTACETTDEGIVATVELAAVADRGVTVSTGVAKVLLALRAQNG